MAKLTKKERAGLPDRAFAYVDSQGHRRVPIHDEAHVRNALARFDRVAFEDDAAEERADYAANQVRRGPARADSSQRERLAEPGWSEPCVMNRNYGRQETGGRVSWRKNRWIEAQEPANRSISAACSS